MARITYAVREIACEGCADAIKRALGALTGVTHVEVDVSAKRVSADFDESRADAASIRRRLGEAGFAAEQVED